MKYVSLLFVGLTLIFPGVARAGSALVLHYRFEDGRGAVVRDVSGSGNHGEIHGPRWTNRGRAGGALVFDGVDDYVRSTTYPLNPAKTDFSASVWFKPLHAVDGYWGIVTQTNKQGQGRFWINTSGRGRLRTKIGNPDDAPVIQGKTTLAKDAWHHAVITYRSGAIRLYLNGKLEASGKDRAESTLGDTVLGSHKALDTSFFNGIIDELQIYKRALDPAEVAFLFRNPASVIGGASPDAGPPPDAGTMQDAATPDAGTMQDAATSDASPDASVAPDAGDAGPAAEDAGDAGDAGPTVGDAGPAVVDAGRTPDTSGHDAAASPIDSRPAADATTSAPDDLDLNGGGCASVASTPPLRDPLSLLLALLLWGRSRRSRTRRAVG